MELKNVNKLIKFLKIFTIVLFFVFFELFFFFVFFLNHSFIKLRLDIFLKINLNLYKYIVITINNIFNQYVIFNYFFYF